MEPFLLKDLENATGARWRAGAKTLTLTGVCTDSRQVCPGDLFIALRGPNFDGNQFARAALEAGASAVLVTAGFGPITVSNKQAVYEADDTSQALCELASWYRGKFSIPTIAITGSCGKTTTKEILAHLLSQHFRTVKSAKSFNNAVGVPLTIFSMDRRTQAAVFEIGTNAPGEIAQLTALVRPKIGVITNVQESHLLGLGSIEGVLQEKGALFEALPQNGFAVWNADDPRSKRLPERTKAQILSVSCSNENAQFWASELIFHGVGSSFRLNGKDPITLPLIGTHNVYNVLQALAVCHLMGLDLPTLYAALNDVPVASHRLERKRFGSIEVLDDSYNSNPGSARAAIRALQGLRGAKRKVLVLGEMLELGQHSEQLHFEIGQELARSGVDYFIGIGRESSQMVRGALEAGMSASKLLFFENTKDAVEGLPGMLRADDLVLVKGSRRLALETIVGAIAEQFQKETVQSHRAISVGLS